MMNTKNMKGTSIQMTDWKRRLFSFAVALTLLISSCGLTAFAESSEDIYSAPVTAPIEVVEEIEGLVEEEAVVTPEPEKDAESDAEPEEDVVEAAETDEETEPEAEITEEPENPVVYEPGTLTAEIDGVGVTLEYTAEARIPEGALLTLSRVVGGEYFIDMKASARVLREKQDGIWKREIGDEAVFYHIRLTDAEGTVLSPDTGVKLTCTNLTVPVGSAGFVIGANTENVEWDGDLTIDFLPEAVGYVNLKMVQIGSITLVHTDRDYMVTASYGPEAGFPFGTALKVREIMPGTPEYNLYSGMTDEALNEDWSEITLERYFDISFVKDGEELEPQADVDVQITFRDKIEENEETEVQAVHIENNEAAVIEFETDSQRAAKHDAEAIDTVTFTSDSFSVFGIVQRKKIVTKILDAQGRTYEIEVTYTQEAEIPEDARVKVEEIPEGSGLWEAYRIQTAAALNADDVRLPGLYDISIVDAEGHKVDPRAAVNVAIKLLNDDNTSDDIQVVHFKEEIPQEFVEAAVQTQETAEQIEVRNEPLAEEEKIESEKIAVAVEGDTVTFNTDSFSVYAFAYTVDFHYEGVDWSIEGNSQILLSDLIPILNIRVGATEEDEGELLNVTDVESVAFTDEHLVTVRQVSGLITYNGVENKDVGEKDFLLSSLEPFTSDEKLIVTLVDGTSIDNTIVIEVTDEQQYSLEDFITDAKLVIDGRTYGSGEPWPARPDVDYQLKLTFSEQGSRQFPEGGSEMVMNLPEGLSFKPGASGSFDLPVGYAGTLTGNTWWVDEQGKVHIKFANDPDNLLTRSSNIYINLDFIVTVNHDVTTFSFNDYLTDTIRINDETDIDVQKNGYYDAADGKMHYTLTIKSTGRTENIKITDTFPSSNLLTLDQDSIVIRPQKQMVTGGSFESTGADGFVRTIAEMSHNETVTVNYTASVNYAALGEHGRITGVDGKNNVCVDTGDNHDETEHIVHEIQYSDVSKASTSTVDNGDGTVTLGWKITANEDRHKSIAGGSVTDTIGYNSKDQMHYAVETSGDHQGKLALQVVRKDGNGVVSTETVYVDVAPAYPNGPDRWVYQIPSNDGNYTYEITYNTVAVKTAGTASVTNDTSNEDGGHTSGAGIVPGTDPSGDDGGDETLVVAKTATRVTEEYVDWSIVISVPETGLDSLVVTDDLPWQYGPESTGDFADTLIGEPAVSGLVGDETFIWAEEVVSAYWKNDPQNKWLKRNGEPLGRHVVTLTFYKDSAKTQSGLTAQARTLTISLRSRNDEKWLDWAAGDGGTYYDTHTNNAKVNHISVSAVARPVKSTLEKTKESTLTGLDFKTENEKNGPFFLFDLQISNVTSAPFVIEDTFDTSLLELVEINTLKGESRKLHKVRYGERDYDRHHISGDEDTWYPTYEQTETGIRITVSDSNLVKKTDGSYYPYYDVYYILRLKDGVEDLLKAQALINGGTYKIRNTAVWNGVEDSYDIEYKIPMLDKRGALVQGQDRLYHYIVTINPDRMTLNGGVAYTLIDTHTSNLSVDYTTVTVRKNDSTENDDTVSWDFEGNTGTFTLEDATSYVIEYDALILGTGQQTFSNTVEMKGFHAETTGSVYLTGTVSGGGDIYQIKLLKYEDGKTSKGLQGAKFQLFRDNGNGGKLPMKWGVGSATAGKVGQNITFTTDSKGYVLIALDQSEHGNELEADVKYYLKEIETPAGYMPDDGAPEYWEFTLTKDPDAVSYGTGGQWIYFCYNDILKMANVPTEEPVTVSVNKQWLDENGQEIADRTALTASVQLYRKTNNGDFVKVRAETSGADVTVTEVTDQSGEVTLDADNGWSWSWENLPRVNGEDKYSYKVEETAISGWAVSSSERETGTIKTYTLINHRIPENTDLSVRVNKEWKDKDGEEISGASDTLPEAIQFYIYQVASREPFTGSPLSGGVKYVRTGDSHLVNGSANDSHPDYAKYQLTKEDGWTALIENLPMVQTTVDDGTMYYAYYVKEIPVAGYTGDMTVSTAKDSQTGVLTTTVELTNRELPEPIDLTVLKVWQDDSESVIADPPNHTVVFHLYQVSGNTPFGTDPDDWPTSGGVLFNYEYGAHSNRVVYDNGERVQGTYTFDKNNGDGSGYCARFDNLPSCSVDAKGKATYYAYYVDEVEIDGYSTTTALTRDAATGVYTITINNRQIPKYTSVSADKAWLNKEGGGELLIEKTDADEVTLEVYQIEGTGLPAGSVMINGQEQEPGELKTITVLGKGNTEVVNDRIIARNGDTIRVVLSFTDDDANHWNSVYIGYGTDQNANKVKLTEDGQGSQISYSNTFTVDDDAVYILAGAGWTSGAKATLTVENTTVTSLQYRLTQSDAESIISSANKVGELKLNKSNRWSDTLSGLLAELRGTKYTYFVVEQNGSDYQAEYVYDGTTVHVTNREKDMLEIDKKWLNAGGTDYTASKTDGTVSVDLYQVKNMAAWSDTYSRTGSFKVDLSGLKVLSYNGAISIPDARVQGNDGKIKSGSRVKISITTTDKHNSPLDGEITVSGATREGEDEYTVIRSDGTFHDFNKYLDLDNQYRITSHTRSIVVSNVTGDIVLSGVFDAQGSVINNLYNISISVLGEPISGAAPSGDDLTRTQVGEITVGYHSASIDLKPAFEDSGITAFAGKQTPWSVLIANLPADGPDNSTYTYYVVEHAVAGFDTDYDANPAGTDGKITIRNQQHALASLRVEKAFLGLIYENLSEEQKAALDRMSFTVAGPDDYRETVTLAEAMEGKTLTGLTPGSYTVTETRPDNSTPEPYEYIKTTVQVGSAQPSDALSASAAVNTGSVAVVKFVNEYARFDGSLVISKNIVNTDNQELEPDPLPSFPITVSTEIGGTTYYVNIAKKWDGDANAYVDDVWEDENHNICIRSELKTTSPETALTVTPGKNLVIKGLRGGNYTYTVTEENPGSVVVTGYEFVQSASTTAATLTFDEEEEEIALTNKYSKGASVKVTKSFAGVDALPDGFYMTASWTGLDNPVRLPMEYPVGFDIQDDSHNLDHFPVSVNGSRVAIYGPYTKEYYLARNVETEGKPDYAWTIDGLSAGTVVTFTEYNGSVVNKAWTAAVTDGSGTSATELNPTGGFGGTGTAAYVDPQTVAFMNTYQPAGLNLKKIVETGAGLSADRYIEYTDGTFEFTVAGPTGGSSQNYTVIITMENGAMKGASLNGTALSGGETAIAGLIASFDPEEGVYLSGMTPGTYTVTEGEWTPDSSGENAERPEGMNMLLKEIGLTDAGAGGAVEGNQATVDIADGVTAVVAYTNILEMNPDIRILKIEENTRNDSTPVPIADVRFSLFRWNGTSYQLYTPDGENSAVAETDEDGEAVFHHVEPGEYKLEETAGPARYQLLEKPVYFRVEYTAAEGAFTVTRFDKAAGETPRNPVTSLADNVDVTPASAAVPAVADPGTGAVITPARAAVPVTFTVGNMPETTEITVNKIWLQPDGTDITESIQNAAVRVQLIKVTNAGESNETRQIVAVDLDNAPFGTEGIVTLNGSPDPETGDPVWSYTWTNLPKYDDENHLITYTVVETEAKVETNVGGGVSVFVPDSGEETKAAVRNASTGIYELTNRLPGTTVSVNKVWEKNGVCDWPAGVTVEVGLYQGETPVTVKAEDSEEHIPYTAELSEAEGKQRYTFTGIPKYDDSGAVIDYSVREIGAVTEDGQTTIITGTGEDQETWLVLINQDPLTGDYTITNTQDRNRIFVVKRWYNANGVYVPGVTEKVHVTIYKVGDSSWTPIVTEIDPQAAVPYSFPAEEGASYYAVETDDYHGDYITRYSDAKLDISYDGKLKDEARFLGEQAGNQVTVQAGGTLYIMNTATQETQQFEIEKKWIEFRDPNGTTYPGQLDGANTTTDRENYMKIVGVMYYDAYTRDGKRVTPETSLPATNEFGLWNSNSGIPFTDNHNITNTIFLNNLVIGGELAIIDKDHNSHWLFNEYTGSGWENGVVGQLPKTGYSEDGELVTYRYWFKETGVYDLREGSSGENEIDDWWVTWKDENTYTTSKPVRHTVVNRLKHPGSINIEKTWDGENLETQAILLKVYKYEWNTSAGVDITGKLKQDAAKHGLTAGDFTDDGNYMKLTNAKQWKLTVRRLDYGIAVGDEQLNKAYYYIQEEKYIDVNGVIRDVPGDWTITYTGSANGTGEKDLSGQKVILGEPRTANIETLYVNNKIPTTSIEVKKQWKNTNGDDREPGTEEEETIKYKVFSRFEDGTAEPYLIGADDDGNYSITYSADTHLWTSGQHSNLPVYRIVSETRDEETVRTVKKVTGYFVEEQDVQGKSFTVAYVYRDKNGNVISNVEEVLNGSVVIVNTDVTAGVELPSTGGSGTLIYTIAGMALIALAGVLLVSRRKRKV